MMTRIGIPLSLVLLVGIFAQPSVHGGIIQYSDRTTFESAVGTFSTEDLDSIAAGTSFHNTTLALGEISLVLNTKTSGYGVISDAQPTYLGPATGHYGTAYTSRDGTGMYFTFDTATTAFGLDVALLNQDLERTKVLIDGTQVSLGTLGSGKKFVGFTSDTAFTEVRFDGAIGNGWEFDNLTFASANSSVPEPASLAIFGVATLGLVVGRARRRKHR